MNNEASKNYYLSLEELEKITGGNTTEVTEGEMIIGHCAACGAWFNASNSKICPKCGKSI